MISYPFKARRIQIFYFGDKILEIAIFKDTLFALDQNPFVGKWPTYVFEVSWKWYPKLHFQTTRRYTLRHFAIYILTPSRCARSDLNTLQTSAKSGISVSTKTKSSLAVFTTHKKIMVDNSKLHLFYYGLKNQICG